MARYTSRVEALNAIFNATISGYSSMLDQEEERLEELVNLYPSHLKHQAVVDLANELEYIKYEKDVLERKFATINSSLEALRQKVASSLSLEDLKEIYSALDLIDNSKLTTSFKRDTKEIDSQIDRASTTAEKTMKDPLFAEVKAPEAVDYTFNNGVVETVDKPIPLGKDIKFIDPSKLTRDVISDEEIPVISDSRVSRYIDDSKINPGAALSDEHYQAKEHASEADDFIKVVSSTLLEEAQTLSDASSTKEILDNSAKFTALKREISPMVRTVTVARRTYEQLASYQMRIACCHQIQNIIQFNPNYNVTRSVLKDLLFSYYDKVDRINKEESDEVKIYETMESNLEKSNPSQEDTPDEYAKETRLRLAKQGVLESDYYKEVNGRSPFDMVYVEVLQEALAKLEDEKDTLSDSLGMSNNSILGTKSELDKDIDKALGIDSKQKVELMQTYNDICEKIDSVKTKLMGYGIFSDLHLLNEAYNTAVTSHHR